MSKLFMCVPMYHPMKMQQLNGNCKRAINSLQVECNKELIRCIAEIFNVLPYTYLYNIKKILHWILM